MGDRLGSELLQARAPEMMNCGPVGEFFFGGFSPTTNEATMYFNTKLIGNFGFGCLSGS